MNKTHTSNRISSTATAVIWASTIAAAMGTIFVAYVIGLAAVDPAEFFNSMFEEFGLDQKLSDLPSPQNEPGTFYSLGVAALWLVTDVIGLVLLLSIRMLFVSIKSEGVFTHMTAKRVRRIGWLIFSLAPASIFLNAACAILVHLLVTPNSIHGQIGLSDTDMYALVVGLTVVAFGHIMVDATSLSEENKAFV